jgi:hypothetical protein
MDLTFLSCFKAGSSIVSPTFTIPDKTVPVKTVPYPLIWKQWSIEKRKGESGVTTLFGISRIFKIVTIKSSIPIAPMVGV